MANNSEKRWFTPSQFLEFGSGAFSRNWLYNQLATGQIHHVRIGTGERQKILIPSDALSRMIQGGAGQPEQPTEARGDSE